jgi:hypothetical protein
VFASSLTSESAAKKMEEMHVAEAEAEQLAHQEGMYQMLGCRVIVFPLTRDIEAKKKEAEHVANAEAEQLAHQEGMRPEAWEKLS